MGWGRRPVAVPAVRSVPDTAMHVLPPRSRLPLGRASFRLLRQDGDLYVDKTRAMVEMIRAGEPYAFLARPRRFGKSLLTTTLEALFRGERALFAGTWIQDSDWAWEAHPVIRLDMSTMSGFERADLRFKLCSHLTRIGQKHGVDMPAGSEHPDWLLSTLIDGLSARNRVVVLVDEYDAPIIRNLQHPQALTDIREELRDFYGILKASEEHLRFVFLTGITRFARTSIFSGLNNLRDLSHLAQCSAVVGFTEADLDRSLAPYVEVAAAVQECSVPALRDRLRDWYDGYLFAVGGQRVYNPYSLLSCLEDQTFGNYWAETATPTFLVDLIQEGQYDITDIARLDPAVVTRAVYEPEAPDVSALLYQTGYLTLQGQGTDGAPRLGFPNREVERTFAESLLPLYGARADLVRGRLGPLGQAWARQDHAGFFARFNDLLQELNYTLIPDQHRLYQMLLHLLFTLLGYHPLSEQPTLTGRLDTVVEMADRVVILEYKLGDTAAQAVRQIVERGYGQRFAGRGKAVVGLGVEIDAQRRQVVAWQALALA